MKKFLILLLLLDSSFFLFAKNKPIADVQKLLIQKGVKYFNNEESSDNNEISTKNLVIDLKNPKYTNGILTTHEGGVVKNKDLRIQAKVIQYIKKQKEGKLIHKIEADQDLMFIYKNRIFVGDELEYDFITKTGTIYNARTYSSPWYLGGDVIEINKDGSYSIKNAYITTCENKESSWDIHAQDVKVEKKDLLKAKKVRFRFFKFPTFWLPSFKINLKKFIKKPIIKYKFNWDKKVGPKASFRYQAYSWKDFLLFLRFDYRFKTGPGGAIETEYIPAHKRTYFVTKNYLAKDTIEKELKDERRYRVQGIYKTKSSDEKTFADISWDKFSDIRMPGDFRSDDFEINTAKKTEALIMHRRENNIYFLHSRPRLNYFETIKQDIPTAYVNVRPLNIMNSNFVFSNFEKFSYLKMAYSNDISPSLSNISSFRFETQNEVFRSINFFFLNICPKLGFIGILYTDSPEKEAKALAMISYNIKAKTDFYRNFKKHKHVIEPYLEYIGLTKPNTVNSHYIFSINDGYNKLNLLKFGILNQVFSLNKQLSNPRFEVDLFANGFIASNIFLGVPKAYLDLNWNLPSFLISSRNGWNFKNHLLDFSNLRLKWTASENVALALEFRHRNKYRWRKADHENFILDVSRPERLLLTSPLSDRRNTFLIDFFLRITPYITCRFESHHGYKRKNEPSYNEFKIDLFTTLSASWKISVSYQKTETDSRFSFDYFLLKI